MALEKPKRGYRFTFGYGSNMCLGRMRCRVPSACPIAVAELPNHVFAFHKQSDDGSGKGDAFRTGNATDRVLGVVFELHKSDLPLLDTAEGKTKGYKVRWLLVNEVGGTRTFKAKTYIAMKSHIDANLQPYTWYRRHVVEGAGHFNLEPDYVAKIAAKGAIADPRPSRARRQLRFPCDHDVDPADWADLDCNDSELRPCD